MLQGKDFGVAISVLGGGLFTLSVLSMIICQITKGSLFDLNPIVNWMLIFGAFGIAWGGFELLKGDVNKDD